MTALYLNLKNGNDIGGGGPVLTGPSFVDKDNIDVILPFATRAPANRPAGGRPADGRPASRTNGTTEVLMSQTSEKEAREHTQPRSRTGCRSDCSAEPWHDPRSVPSSRPS